MVFQNGEIVLVRKNNNALGQLYKATIVSSATRELTGTERGVTNEMGYASDGDVARSPPPLSSFHLA